MYGLLPNNVVQNTLRVGTLSNTNMVEVGGVVNTVTGYRHNNLATSGQFLRGNGTNIVLAAIQASDISTVQFWTRDTGNGYIYPTTLTDWVGIGTVTPYYKLSVVGEGADTNQAVIETRTYSSTNTYDRSIFLLKRARGSEASPTNINNGDMVGSFQANCRSNTWFNIASIDFEVDGAFVAGQRPPGRLILGTTEANGTITDRLTIKADGKIGAGIGTPVSLFELYSSTSSPILTITGAHATDYDPQVQFRTDAAATVKCSHGVDGADDKYKIYMGEGIGGTTQFVIDTNGDIGIGTSSPNANSLTLTSKDIYVDTYYYFKSNRARWGSWVTNADGDVGGFFHNMNYTGSWSIIAAGKPTGLFELDTRDGDLGFTIYLDAAGVSPRPIDASGGESNIVVDWTDTYLKFYVQDSNPLHSKEVLNISSGSFLITRGDVDIAAGSLTINTIAAEATDVDAFLVSNAGLVKYRTGAQVLSDIGASASSHLHDGDTLQCDGINSDGGAFSFTTTGIVTFNQIVAGVDPTLAAHLATKNYVDQVAAGSAKDFFLSNTASGVGSVYTMYPAETGEAESTLTSAGETAGDDQLIFGWLTEAGEPGIVHARAGIYELHIHLNLSTGDPSTVFYWTISKVDADGSSNETLLVTSEASGEIPITTPESFETHAFLATGVDLDATSRYLLQVYVNVTGGGTSFTTVSMEGSHDCHLSIKVPSDIFQTQGDVLDDLNTLGTVASDGQFLVGTGAGVFAWESGSTVRTSLGLGTGDTPEFTGLTIGADVATITHSGTTSLEIVSTSGTVIIEGGTTFTGANVTGMGTLGCGAITTTGQLLLPSGLVGTPSLSFTTSPTTGFCSTAFNIIGVSINGALDFTYTADAFNVLAGSSINMEDDTYIQIGAGALVFDDTPVPDQIRFDNLELNLNDNFMYFDADGDTWIGAQTDDEIWMTFDAAVGIFRFYFNEVEDFNFTNNSFVGTPGSTMLMDTMTIATGSITDSTGAISFVNENLVTTGTLGCGTITSSGDITCGHIAIGGGAIDPDKGILYIGEILTDTDNSIKLGLHIYVQTAKTSAAMTSSAWGAAFDCVLDSSNTQNWTNVTTGLTAVQGRVSTEASSTGTITEAAGLLSHANFANAATVTNFRGVLIQTPTVAGAKLTNEYGLYIQDQNTGSTLNYAIYTNAGLVRFGDAVSSTGTITGATLTDGTFSVNGGAITGATTVGCAKITTTANSFESTSGGAFAFTTDGATTFNHEFSAVKNTNAGVFLGVTNLDAGNAAYAGMLFSANATNCVFQVYGSGHATKAYETWIGTTAGAAAAQIVFQHAGNEYMRMSSTLFNTQIEINTYTAKGTNYLKIRDNRSTTGDQAGIMLSTYPNQDYYKTIIAHVETGGGAVGDLVFALDVNGDAASATIAADEKIRFKKEGNINILTGNGYQVNDIQVVSDQEAHEVDADGTLADITTKFNSILSKLESHGLLASS